MAAASRTDATPPKKVRIGYADYSVLQGGDVQDIMDDTLNEGISNGNVLKILLRSDRPFVNTAETLLHEILHQCLFMAGLELERDVEEPIVRAMSMHLFSVLRDNPKLVSYLTHKE